MNLPSEHRLLTESSLGEVQLVDRVLEIPERNIHRLPPRKRTLRVHLRVVLRVIIPSGHPIHLFDRHHALDIFFTARRRNLTATPDRRGRFDYRQTGHDR